MGLINVSKLKSPPEQDYDGGLNEPEDQKHEYDAKVAGSKGNNNGYDAKLAEQSIRKHEYEEKLAGEKRGLAGPKRGQNAPMAGGWRSGSKPFENKVLPIFFENPEKNAQGGIKKDETKS